MEIISIGKYYKIGTLVTDSKSQRSGSHTFY